MFRLALVAVVAVAATAPAQPKVKPDPKTQLSAAVSKELGGGPGTAYVVVLVTETPDQAAALAKTGGFIVDLFSLAARAPFWVSGSNSPLPWVSPMVNPKSSWAAEVAVFADRKSAADAIAAFGVAAEAGKPRTWRLLKKAEGLAAAMKAGDAEQAKLDKQAQANAKLTVTRRPNPEPPAKK